MYYFRRNILILIALLEFQIDWSKCPSQNCIDLKFDKLLTKHFVHYIVKKIMHGSTIFEWCDKYFQKHSFRNQCKMHPKAETRSSTEMSRQNVCKHFHKEIRFVSEIEQDSMSYRLMAEWKPRPSGLITSRKFNEALTDSVFVFIYYAASKRGRREDTVLGEIRLNHHVLRSPCLSIPRDRVISFLYFVIYTSLNFQLH